MTLPYYAYQLVIEEKLKLISANNGKLVYSIFRKPADATIVGKIEVDGVETKFNEVHQTPKKLELNGPPTSVNIQAVDKKLILDFGSDVVFRPEVTVNYEYEAE